ncbi:type IV secretion system DNA-binding domain-containing protein [Sulfitobacter sp. M220]|uniref:type IV secretory system conjugative DNA transfer family protein n=1 Tax=Sulfitobacter sp. M220 TaxID=2675333 RepID=UPI001F025888|nr:type IV secretory system conjugative DNA transfer family protein [Sulfitobacter sp. M220]MCF7779078.1 type IV secretion system DNA-binding domain-containing protein [Sulfitobacter sp. M220]|tara:strand:+ start:874 stop:2157 length:1284 start_codon:yes stop_codon:yes gene_type:complete
MTHAINLGYTLEDTRAPLGFGAAPAPNSAGGALIRDDSDAGLVTIAGTGTGKGVSQVIPTALTYPGSMVIMDTKGEIAAVTARARREMGQEVVILDPFGKSTDALNPMEMIDPASIDAPDQCNRLARMMNTKGLMEDPFWDDMSQSIISGTLLFLATHIPRAERSMALLHRMWGVSDHLEEMLACMEACDLHGGAMAAASRAYTSAPDKTAGSILTTMRNHIGFLTSARSQAGLSGGWGLLKRIREGVPMTIYLRVPPHLLSSHGQLLRIWLGTILNTVAQREQRPEIPDLFLVDEAATLGHLDELLTAASLLRGYGLRTWTFWQSIGQIETLYGARASEFLDNAGTLSMFGASNAAAANNLRALTGYEGQILGIKRDEQVICRQGNEAQRAVKLNYLTDPAYQGRFDPNPFYARPQVKSRGMEIAA